VCVQAEEEAEEQRQQREGHHHVDYLVHLYHSFVGQHPAKRTYRTQGNRLVCPAAT
jgi:hypothetical protein